MKKIKRIRFIFPFTIFFSSAILIFLMVLLLGKTDEKVEGYGIVSPEDEEIISSTVSGIISHIYVKEGSVVDKGAQIIKINDKELEFQKELAIKKLYDSEEELLELKREYDRLNSDNSSPEIEKTKLILLKSNLNFKKAAKDYEMKKNFYKEGIISLKELIDSEIGLQIYDLERKSAKEELKLLLERKEREKISLESKLKASEKAYEIAREQLLLVSEKIEETNIKSPINGVILGFSLKKDIGERNVSQLSSENRRWS